MRTRRHANTERLRSKEMRLKQALLRREFSRLYGALSKGIVSSVSHTTPVGGTTSTVHAPLLALVETAAEEWQVDFDTVPDSTGGFGNVNIEAGKQIGELAADQVLSFAGQSIGTYTVYAQHNLVDENPEQRSPPGKYAGGTGVYAEHRAFFGHGKADGTPIPREGYDSTLTPETVSEAVDRLSIAYAPKGSEPANATPLIEVVWNGTSIASATVVARTVSLDTLYNHIGAGGSAHAAATTGTAGFMSATDKAKLDSAATGAGPFSIVYRDGNGRAQFADPAVTADAATKRYVDNTIAAETLRALGASGAKIIYGSVSQGGTVTAPSAFGLSGSSDLSVYTITHGLGTTSYVVMAMVTTLSDRFISKISKGTNSFAVTIGAPEGIISPSAPFDFIIIAYA